MEIKKKEMLTGKKKKKDTIEGLGNQQCSPMLPRAHPQEARMGLKSVTEEVEV